MHIFLLVFLLKIVSGDNYETTPMNVNSIFSTDIAPGENYGTGNTGDSNAMTTVMPNEGDFNLVTTLNNFDGTVDPKLVVTYQPDVNNDGASTFPLGTTVAIDKTYAEIPKEWLKGGGPIFPDPIHTESGIDVMPYNLKVKHHHANPYAYGIDNNEPSIQKPLNSNKPISPWLHYFDNPKNRFNFTIKNNQTSLNIHSTKSGTNSWHLTKNSNLTHSVKFFEASNNMSKNDLATSQFNGRKNRTHYPNSFSRRNSSRNDLVSSSFKNSGFNLNTMTNSSGFRPGNDTVRKSRNGLHRNTNRTISSRTMNNKILANLNTTRRFRSQFTSPKIISKIPRIPTSLSAKISTATKPTTTKPTTITERTTLIYFIPYHHSQLTGQIMTPY